MSDEQMSLEEAMQVIASARKTRFGWYYGNGDLIDRALDAAIAAMGGVEAVAWQVRSGFSDGSWSGWAQMQSQQEAEHLVSRFTDQGVRAEWRALYALPAPPSKEG